MAWSAWCAIDKPADYDGCAVYRIRLAQAGRPVALGRFLDTDAEGSLCIGQTGSFDRRRTMFMRALKGHGGHSEGNLLHILEGSTALKTLYPESVYQYSFRRVDSEVEAKVAEERLIKAYVKRFGEPPPLNCNIPGRHDKESWQALV